MRSVLKIQYNEFVYLLPEKSVLLREQKTINIQVYSFDFLLFTGNNFNWDS